MSTPLRLNRILGLGFGIALAFGNTIGVGILRLPGQVAEAVSNPWWFFAIWALGGVYALLGALNVGELAAMMPAVGGFYVYAKRAFGPRAGFLVGWNDWILNVVTLGYASITAAEFLQALLPSLKTTLVALWSAHIAQTFLPQSAEACVLVAIAMGILLLFTALHWRGVVMGSQTQNLISVSVGLVLVVMAVAGFFVTAPATVAAAAAPAAPAVPAGEQVPFWASVFVALRLVIVSYDGWYGAIYMAGETQDAARNVPKAMVSCALLVTGLYLLINAGFVHALGMDALRHSTLPAAAVARALLPAGADRLVTAVSLLTVLSLINATMLGTPRILLAVAQDGFAKSKAAQVSDSGTPRVALLLSVAVVLALLVAGSLTELIAISADLFVLNYLTAYSAMLWLRWREPMLDRPFKTPGFPVTTLLVFLGSIGFLIAAVWDDPKTALSAAGLLGVGVIVALGLRRPTPV
jgi:basic amino acid/polyamine antiporter, APA family